MRGEVPSCELNVKQAPHVVPPGSSSSHNIYTVCIFHHVLFLSLRALLKFLCHNLLYWCYYNSRLIKPSVGLTIDFWIFTP